MGVQELTQYFAQYGAFFVFFIVLLEYLNLPRLLESGRQKER